MSNLTPIIKDSFLQFSGAVLQSRALSDARDNLKPSVRQILYCMYTDKFTHDKPFKKTLKAVGSAFRVYIHGDSSAVGIIMRAAQPYAYRYPLVEVEGSYGTLIAANSYAAPRYTSSRLSKLSEFLFKDIEKQVINEWRDNYDDTEQYPMVLPSKGFYNIVNGNFGLGVGMSASIPQYNLKEINEALIKLLWNPNIDFEEIYCAPDFATGGLLLNENEVKESHKLGQGKACKLRSKITFDNKERCLIVTEIPYMVYTETICGQLEEIINNDDNPGIDRFNDLTGENPNIKIYLTKKANVDKVLKFLYKNTSLQTHYGINFTGLENGRYPKVFTWKQLLQSHIEHEKEVYRRGFEFDLRKIKDRLHIVEGILIALASIEEVIETIKKSSSTKEANQNLCKNFLLDEIQAKAILDMKLARLAKLEVKKYEEEKEELLKEKNRIEEILNNEFLFKKEVERGLREVAEKFGDARRTKILNIENEDDEPTEVKSLLISLTNQNNIFVSENSSLFVQRRGGVGAKFKLNKGEYVVSTSTAETTDSVLFFTDKGNFYNYVSGALPIDDKIPVESLFGIKSWEKVTAMSSYNKKNSKEYIIFFTKNGIMKKSRLEDYNMKRSGALKAIELDKDDEVVNVIFTNEEAVAICTAMGNLCVTESKEVRPIGRTARGVKGITLSSGDYVVCASAYPSSPRFVCSVSSSGYIKKVDSSEIVKTGRGTKGKKIQKTEEEDSIIGFLTLTDEKDLIITSNSARIKIDINSIPLLSRGAQGNKSIKLKDNEKVIGISKF